MVLLHMYLVSLPAITFPCAWEAIQYKYEQVEFYRATLRGNFVEQYLVNNAKIKGQV